MSCIFCILTVISQYGYGENIISCMNTITQIVIEKSPADSPLLDYPNEMTSVTSKPDPLSSNVYDMKTTPIYPYFRVHELALGTSKATCMLLINSMWPGDVIWRHRSQTTLFPATVFTALWMSATIAKVRHMMTSRDTIMNRVDLRGIHK